MANTTGHGTMKTIAASVLLAVLCTAMPASAADPEAADELDVTMRLIGDPEALRPESITRRLSLPTPQPAPAAAQESSAAAPPAAQGLATSEAARELGREHGQEVAERAREMAEQAREQREDFGRSRAEEMRPEPPQNDRPVPPGH
jgi:pyruvate/2-oxoglutarate dehydrogenase complex dihydrolipoamide acyltransferase (E2) component